MAPAKSKQAARKSIAKKRASDVANGLDDIDIKPAIRPRLENSTTKKLPSRFDSLRKHPKFYYDDGSITLVTKEGADPATLFRVSRRQLESISSKLRQMFAESLSVPEGSKQQPGEYEGCPVVELEETAADVEALFEILWNGFFVEPELRSHQCVTGVLRLSTKWEVDHLRAWSISCLEAKIPMTYEKFEKDPKLKVFTSPNPWISPMDVLKLHYEFNFPIMAALTWYYLSTMSWEAMASDEVESWFQPTSTSPYAPMEKLVIGRERMRSRCMNFLYGQHGLSKLGDASCNVKLGLEKCPSNSSVIKRLRNWQHVLSRFFQEPLRAEWVLQPVTEKVCPNCKTAFLSEVYDFENELFNDLPRLFNIQV